MMAMVNLLDSSPGDCFDQAATNADPQSSVEFVIYDHVCNVSGNVLQILYFLAKHEYFIIQLLNLYRHLPKSCDWRRCWVQRHNFFRKLHDSSYHCFGGIRFNAWEVIYSDRRH